MVENVEELMQTFEEGAETTRQEKDLTICAAWADGNKTEQKYARFISAYRTVKSDTTYLEVK